MEDKLQAPKIENLHLVFSGDTKIITTEKIDGVRRSICKELGFKISEVLFDTTSPYSPGYTRVLFHIPSSKEKIQQLLFGAIEKESWLINLGVIELKVGKKAVIKLAERKEKKRQSFHRVKSVLGGHFTSGVYFDTAAWLKGVSNPGQVIFCSNTFDIILAIELPITVDEKKCNTILTQCEAAIKAFHSHPGRHVESLKLRLALIRFGNHVAVPIRQPKEQQVAFLEKELTNDLNISTYLKAKGRLGGNSFSGIADALDRVCSLKHQVCREATKLCIMICFISSRSANLEHYKSPFDYDAIKLSHDLAKNAIPLYIIGIDLDGVQTSDPSGSHEVEENYFLSGITATTGGRYFPIQNINTLEEAIKCIIKENSSIERNMGTVSDVVIAEINKQYGDVNDVHLTEYLHNSFSLKSSEIECITQNDKPLTAISQISERVSWADNLDDAIMGVETLKKRFSSSKKIPESQAVWKARSPVDKSSPGLDALSTSQAKGIKGAKKPKEFLIVKKNSDLEVCGRMVRREIERRADYRPTTEGHFE